MTDNIINYLTSLKYYNSLKQSIENANTVDDLTVNTSDFLEMALRELFPAIKEKTLSQLNAFYDKLRQQACNEITDSSVLQVIIDKPAETHDVPECL